MGYLSLMLIAVGMRPSAGRADESRTSVTEEYTAYLMAYFGPEEKLFYAYSHDARNWAALNDGKPVFDAKVRLRDPFINRAWTPEFFYSTAEGLFYVYWASIHNGHNTIHFVTTRDWTDITLSRSAV